MYSRKRSFRAVSSDQVDELSAESPTLPRVTVLGKNGTCSSTAWRVLHDRLKKKPYKPIKSQRVSAATVSLAWRSVAVSASVLAPLVQGTLVANFDPAAGLLQRREGLQMRVSPAPTELQVLGGPHTEAHGLRRSSPHRQIAVQSRHHGGHGRRLERHRRRALRGTRGQGQQRVLLRTHVAAVPVRKDTHQLFRGRIQRWSTQVVLIVCHWLRVLTPLLPRWITVVVSL